MLYAIETVNLTKKFRRYRSSFNPISYLFGNRDEVLAIDNVTIKIAKGEFVGLVGANKIISHRKGGGLKPGPF